MTQRRWEDFTEDELERLLVERWLYRGGVLAMGVVMVVLFTVVSTSGLETPFEQAMSAVLAVFALLAGGVFVYLRGQDRRIHLLLRDRRRKGD